MTSQRPPRSDLHVLVEQKEKHSAHCATLRARYGSPAPGRVVVEHSATVQGDEARLISAIKRARDLRARELHVLIDSHGGLTASMWRIIEAINGYKGVKRGVVVGRCDSASAVILAACDERIAPPTAEILVHACGFYHNDSRYPYTPPRYTAASLDKEAARLAGTDTKIAELLVQRTKCQAFHEIIDTGKDWHLTAAEARGCNLVTKIEPADVESAAPFSLFSLYYRPRHAAARAAVAAMARKSGTAGASSVSLRLHGDIGRGRAVNAASVRRQLDAAPYANSLLVFINSIGGSVNEAAQIYGQLREHPATRKKAIVSGDCQSAAMLLLMGCDLRIARPTAQMMIHTVAINPWDHRDKRWTAAEHKEAAEQNGRVDAAIADLFAGRTGFDRQWFVEAMKDERPLPLIEALRVGLIHEIDGLTRTPDPAWPARFAAAARSGVIFGLPNHLFSDNYLAACRAASHR